MHEPTEPSTTIPSKPAELVSKGVVVRSILPSDDKNRLWDISVKAMQAIDPRFPITKNKTHEDFDRPFDFYKKENKGDFIIAEIDGQIAGFGGFIDRPEVGINVCEMVRARVDPEFQRTGIGQKIVDELERRAKDMGFTKSFIKTTNHNQTALKLMLKNGYVITEDEPIPDSNFGDDLIVYTLEKSLV